MINMVDSGFFGFVFSMNSSVKFVIWQWYSCCIVVLILMHDGAFNVEYQTIFFFFNIHWLLDTCFLLCFGKRECCVSGYRSLRHAFHQSSFRHSTSHWHTHTHMGIERMTWTQTHTVHHLALNSDMVSTKQTHTALILQPPLFSELPLHQVLYYTLPTVAKD